MKPQCQGTQLSFQYPTRIRDIQEAHLRPQYLGIQLHLTATIIPPQIHIHLPIRTATKVPFGAIVPRDSVPPHCYHHSTTDPYLSSNKSCYKGPIWATVPRDSIPPHCYHHSTRAPYSSNNRGYYSGPFWGCTHPIATIILRQFYQ
jgi:hypothetical protein